MKSLTSKFASSRGWALFLILFLGAGLFVAACGDEDVPTPTTPAPTPPAPPPAPEPEPEPTPEPPAVPVGLRISASGVDFIEWSWSAVEGVSGYDVQYSANEAFTDEDEEIARTAEQISYRRENLEAETNHYLRVRSAAGTGDGRVTSGWSTHVTGMTPAATPPAPVAPAAPANLKVSDTGEDFIEWTWDRVAGAGGYIAQFSTDSRFAAGDPEFTVEGVANTKHKVSKLDAASNGYLRVRAYAGTAADPTLGEWTEGARGTTEEPTAPVTTALSAPTGLRSDSSTSTTVTLSWRSVDDADSYEVEQRSADGSWTGASCNGGDSQVNNEECEASGLTRGSDYSFRVRANPDPDDDTLEQSAWSSTASAQTSGTTPSTPVVGGGDELNIIWESDEDSITWFWDPPSDNRIRFLVALIQGAKTPETRRPACPGLTNKNDDTEFTEASINMGWFGGDEGLHEFARTVGAIDRGDVYGLCVVQTWMDDNRQYQYGTISVAWAATQPAIGTSTGIPAGSKDGDAARKTTAIDWWVQMDEGFNYDIQIVKATIDTTGSDLASCAAAGSGGTTLNVNTDDQSERHRLLNPDAYTEHRACARARSASGVSDWADIGEPYTTLPGAPPSPTYIAAESTVAVSGQSTMLTWRLAVANNAKQPKNPADYDTKAYYWDTPWESQPSLTAANMCGSTVPDGFTTMVATDLTDEGSAFQFTATGTITNQDNPATTTTDEATTTQTYRVVACVRAKLGTDASGGRTGNAALEGPWKVGSRVNISIKPPPSS